jgi:hypothetical protein
VESADDFEVPDGQVFSIASIATSSLYTGLATSAESFDVLFYTDDGTGKPGDATCSFLGLTSGLNLVGDNLVVTLPSPCNLSAGRHWLSIIANMDEATNGAGAWHWRATLIEYGRKAQARDQAGLVMPACETWRPLQSCGRDTFIRHSHCFSLMGSSGPETTTTTTVSSTTSTTLVPGATLLTARKLLVKRKKSGAHRLKLLVKDAAVAAAQPCEAEGELVIESVGAGAPPARFVLDAALWRPIKAKRPEKGCKYRKGPVALTVLLKAGKVLKVVADADDLGVPLATDPRPVRIAIRHGAVRHCVELPAGGPGSFKENKKLLTKGADAASACPPIGSLAGAFGD